MKSLKFSVIFIYIVICIFLFGCKPEEIILHGEIRGIVSDNATGQPLQAVAVKLNPINDTTSTGIDGKYQFTNLDPGQYEVLATKQAYAGETRNATVNSANTTIIHFALQSIPVIHYSKTDLDYGIDLESLSFTISKSGIGKVAYTISPNNDWINVYPLSGDVDNETDTITVTVNRSGLTQDIIKEWIKINTTFLQYESRDTVGIYLNGVMDQDKNYYKVVKIGNQIWMAENLNVGVILSSIDLENRPSNNGIIEKWCYADDPNNCKIYGGLYQWDEMMQYNPPDTGTIGTTQGICPDGWHVPTCKDWTTLIEFYGGVTAGGALKETGTLHWKDPNSGATNISGFTSLGGGWFSTGYVLINEHAVYWGSKKSALWLYSYVINAQLNGCTNSLVSFPYMAASVRCIKDPPKNK